MTGRLPALLVAGLLLAGCGAGTDPADARRADVAAMTSAANDGDADALRQRADALLATVAAQLEKQEVPAGEAERLTALAQSVRTGADAIDADLLQRQRAEAEAEAARQGLAEAERRLAEERARPAQSARPAEPAPAEVPTPAEVPARQGEGGKGKDDKKK